MTAPRYTNRQILQAIASAYDNGLKSLEEAVSDALQALADEVRCNRVSLWRFELGAGGRGLRCFAAKVDGSALTQEATLLAETQYRAYFAALAEQGIYVTNDAMADPKLASMRGPYLHANNIQALLDMPVMINGRAYGIVCCEMTGTPHRWTQTQIRAARQTVTRAGLLVAAQFHAQLDLLDSIPIAAF